LTSSPDKTPPDAGHRPPVTDDAPRLGHADPAAAGRPGVASALAYVLRKSGPVRGTRALLAVNQHTGFDCPSCAWPDGAERAVAEFCENGARAVADEATGRRVDAEFFGRHAISELRGWSDRRLNDQGRLVTPMIRRRGADHYTPINYDEAFRTIGKSLRELDHPDQAVFYTSGRTSNEAAFLYQAFVRAFGTNNLPDCSNMCHESSGVGLTEVLGSGKGSATRDDLERAGAIFVVGQNPGTNHPRMLASLETAKRRGARIVAVNPLREAGLVRFKHPQKLRGLLGPGTELADLFLRVRVGGDIALFKGIAKAMLEREKQAPGAVLDRGFLDRYTAGLDAYLADLEATPWEALETASGVPRNQMEEAAAIAIDADGVVCTWAMGVTQHVHGVANVQTLVAFLLLGGNIGRPGAGPMPVRGHSNVQGDRTMGIWERPPPWVDRLGEELGFDPPRGVGLDTVGAIEAMRDGQARVFFAMGGNFLSATPDTDVTAAALRRCLLTVQVSTKLNRAHLETGETAIILPCLGRTERDGQPAGPQFVTVENSTGVVHPSEGALPPVAPGLLSEPRIVARLAEATLGDAPPIPWSWLADDYDRIREHIARVVPGFEDMNARVRRPGGFLLPHPNRDRVFPTVSGRARFVVHRLPDQPDLTGDPDRGSAGAPERFLMTTIRSHDQFNTTVYGLDDRYRGVRGGRRVVFVHPDDAAALGLAAGARVTLTSHHRGRQRTAPGFMVVPYDLPRGNVATYFPEANPLVPLEAWAEGSRTPASKSVVVSLEAE